MILSASKIKTLNTCSFLFHCSYILKLPRTSNTGANLGTITHEILECLQNKRHRKHYDQLISEKTCKNNLTISRFIFKRLKQLGEKESEFGNVDNFLQVAINTDFFLEGFELGEPELKFDIQNENPKYHILGFMDMHGFKDEVLKVVDYKSQKNIFNKPEMDYNVQALMYLLAAKKLWPNVKKGFVNFIMLRFKKNPVQVASYSEDTLKGFEMYLQYLTEFLSDWTYEKAISNFAAHDPSKKMLCGTEPGFKIDGSPKWVCSAKFPFKYFSLFDKDGKIIKSEFKEEDLKPKEGESVREMTYAGCPVFNK